MNSLEAIFGMPTAVIRNLGVVLLFATLTACGGGDGGAPVAELDTEPVADIPDAPIDTGPDDDAPVDDAPVDDVPPSEPLDPLTVVTGNDRNTISSPLLSLNPAGPGGSPNQSLRAGDVLQGLADNELLIGGLGVDVIFAYDGNDVLIGGTEDFNSSVDGDNRGSDNRDRAFGGKGDDVFIWAPGDGSDFFDGGSGIDVVVFGVLGELRDANGATDGAPFFNVNPPNTDGSQDFDGIYLQPETNLPIVRVSASPGFCTVIDASTDAAALDALGLDHLVRFSLRSFANSFDAGEQAEDDGLRVAVSLQNTEYLVCTRRDIVDGGGNDNIQVIDLQTAPPTEIGFADLPDFVQAQIN